jgi:cell division protein FtsA
MEEKIVVSVDIGTTKVCAVIASVDAAERVNILGVGTVGSQGLYRGTVTYIERTIEAVQESIKLAEQMAGVRVQSVVVGIAGDHIRSFPSRGLVAISNKEGIVLEEDVDRLLQSAMDVPISPDYRILHAIAMEYIVDGQDGVQNPLGMSAVRLEGNVHIITGMLTAIKNIKTCVERAGYQVADIVLQPLASSYAVLHPQEKEVGVVMVDIGGGTTDIAIFEDDVIRHTAVIAIAGNKVTDDIRKGLGVIKDDAEALKREFGHAVADLVSEDEVAIPGLHEGSEKVIRQSTLAQIIQPRLEEILELVDVEIRRSKYTLHLGGGIVLTGGGSMIPGTAQLAESVLGIPARIGKPIGLGGGLLEKVNDPKYATAVGLVIHALESEKALTQASKGTTLSGNVVQDGKKKPLAASKSGFTQAWTKVKEFLGEL